MKNITISVKGYIADTIEKAINASLYGVYGRPTCCAEALRACCNAVEEYLDANNVSWESFHIMGARPSGNREAIITACIEA